MLALLMAAAAVPTAIDAERAFARDAERLGQWTAFARYAHRDAVMFTPQAVWAHEYVRTRKNPPRAMRWWPNASLVSCDGRTAVNTGATLSADGRSHGQFTSVWQRDKAGWQWVYNANERVATPRARRAKPLVRRASCRGRPVPPPLIAAAPAVAAPRGATPADIGRGVSADRTLAWLWRVEAKGARQFRAFLWNGTHYEQVVYNQTAGK
ncbi:MAG TPA: hypothetical protein VM265_09450 [Sphingomicrobium sp.]|nr:hypothetical protein [Sphingomicrobium sp.]